jgi:hypothetical protein
MGLIGLAGNDIGIVPFIPFILFIPFIPQIMNKILSKIIETAYAQELIRCSDGTMADPSIGCVETPSAIIGSESSLVQIILKGANGLMTFVAGLAVIILIYGGIRYAMAMGSEEQIKKAKRIIFWSIIGLIVALLAIFVTDLTLGVIT